MLKVQTLFLSFTLHISGVSTICVDLDSVTQDGNRIISSVFKMVDSVSLYTCVTHCLTVSTCMSVSYQRETHTCHLASQDSAGDPGDVHTDPKFFLTDISLWPRMSSLAGPCDGIACGSGSRCVVDRFNIPSCVTGEHLGCGPAPDLANANKSSTGQYEGAVTQYTCQSDFLFCGTSSTHTCSSLGTWEGLSGACNRAVWHNPTIRFEGAMPCPMSEGFKVRFEGRPTLTRFVMTVKTTGMLLQADSRPGTFYLHKLMNRAWTTHLQVPLTFVVGVNFTCEIVRQNGTYEVYIDETYLGAADDQPSDRHPDTVIANLDVYMDRIIFSTA